MRGGAERHGHGLDPLRLAAGDPRPSLAARYPSHADDVAKVAAAGTALMFDRLLLLGDATRDVTLAQASDVGRQKT